MGIITQIINLLENVSFGKHYAEIALLLIKKRRLQYLHNLVNRKEDEMLYRVFITQWNNPTKGDWTETVRRDLVEFGFSDEYEFLKIKSKLSSRTL